MNNFKIIEWVPVMLLAGALLLQACGGGSTPTAVTETETVVAWSTSEAKSPPSEGSTPMLTPGTKVPATEGATIGAVPEAGAATSEGGVTGSTPKAEATGSQGRVAKSTPQVKASTGQEGTAGPTPGAGQGAVQGSAGAQAPLAYEILDTGSMLATKPAEPSAIVVTQPGQLGQLLSIFPPGTSLDNVTPALLDGNHVIVAIFGGVQGSSGYSVHLQTIRVEDTQVVLEVLLAGPPPNTLTEPALQIPYTIVLVERSAFPAEIGNVIVELHKN
jgi:hypothetical protein